MTIQQRHFNPLAITNYSTTHWFLLADPMDLPTIEVAFLNGQEMPFVETASAKMLDACGWLTHFTSTPSPHGRAEHDRTNWRHDRLLASLDFSLDARNANW